jgi:MFS family permease
VLGLGIVLIGQVVSLLGSAMTGFALTIWISRQTDQATPFTLGGFAFVLPAVVLSIFAGPLVDRSNRKRVMIFSDLAAGLVTLAQLALFATGHLQIWHVYVGNAVQGALTAFQFPAFSTAVTMMVSKEQYARVSGIISLGRAASGVFAPALAAVFIKYFDVTGVMLIDVITFVVAIGALLFVRVPQPPISEEGRESRGSFWKETSFGFRFILQRPSLLGLQLVFACGNLLSGISFALVAPMILVTTGRTEASVGVLGTVQTLFAVGGVAGGLLLSVWGGPKRKALGVVFGWALFGLLGAVVMGLGQVVYVWAVAAFFAAFFGPIIDGSNQAIWQSKVAPDLQGRVFSVRLLIAWIMSPLANLIAGPLADKVFEPAMREGGSLVSVFGGLVGSGPGHGMSLMFIICGLLVALVGLGGYSIRMIRDAEEILPDHDVAAASVSAEVAPSAQAQA